MKKWDCDTGEPVEPTEDDDNGETNNELYDIEVNEDGFYSDRIVCSKDFIQTLQAVYDDNVDKYDSIHLEWNINEYCLALPKIVGLRHETDTEYEERVAAEKARRLEAKQKKNAEMLKKREERERKQLAKLKEKYDS